MRDRRLYLLLTRALCRAEPLATLRAALAGGVDLVQVREKPFPRDAASWIGEVREICRTRGVPVIINDCPDLMRETAADGLHLGQGDLAAFPPGSLCGRDYRLGISTHDPAEMARALTEAPDYVGIGPCFPTTTKGYDRGRTPAEIQALLADAEVPCFAIGGIAAANLPTLLRLGVRRIAVSAAILGADDPRAAAQELRRQLDAAVAGDAGLTAG